MRRIMLFFLAIAMALFMGGCSSRAQLNDMFDAFETETAEKVPYVYFDTLVFNDARLDFGELLEENVPGGVFHEVYAVRDGRIWFGYSAAGRTESGAKQWVIASVDPDGRNWNAAYQGEFCLGSGADQTYARNTNSHSQDSYGSANGVYDDGKIILTDQVKTAVFDLATAHAEEFAATDYDYPAVAIEVEMIDHQTISFCRNSEQKIFNVEAGSQTSEAFKKLYSLQNEKNWQGKSCLSELFDSVQIVNDQVFILCRVLNWSGETHAVVFQYDFENNSCKYAFHCFMNDLIGNDLYVVPVI